MRLYIGNPTKQLQDFCYRTKQSTGMRMQTIHIGTQIAVSGNLTAEDIDFIIEQHERYGMCRADETDHNKEYTGLIYSIDKPITSAKLTLVIEHNIETLVERGKEIRKEAAIAVATGIENNIRDATNDVGFRLRAFETSVTEVEPPGGFRDDGDHLNEGYDVDLTRQSPRTPTRGKRRGRRQAAE